jgi:hypothetical protein
MRRHIHGRGPTNRWDTLLTSGRLTIQDFIASNFRKQASETT